MSDLELARAAVSDLAAASSVVYPVLQWAVAVARGSSGLPELWVATNEGNGFIPAGVFIPRAMALAARFDADFDFRWFGWTHPAETAVAQSVARGILSRQWPSEADWSALASEYEGAVLMASAQRPGLFGIEDHTQLETYHAEFMQCRRMEVLMSWRAGNVADVIYAARCAGVALPLAAVAGS